MFLNLKNLNEGGEEALYKTHKKRLLPEGGNLKRSVSAISSGHSWQNLQRQYLPNLKWEKLRK